LNSNKTKFLSRSEAPNRFIELEFKNPLNITAFGFQSANDFRHLDPKEIKIEVTVYQNSEEEYTY